MIKFMNCFFDVTRKKDPQVNLGEFLKEHKDSSSLIEDLDSITSSFFEKLREIPQVKKLLLLLLDQKQGHFKVRSHFGFEDHTVEKISIQQVERLAKWMKINNTNLNIKEQPHVFDYLNDQEKKLLTKLGVQLCFLMMSMNRFIGILLIGPEPTEKGFSKKEMSLISALTSQAVIEFENALLYNESQERFQRMVRTETVAAISELARDFAHKIRNPLTSIKSSLQYLEKRIQESPHGKSPFLTGQDSTKHSLARHRNKIEEKLLNNALKETERINRILAGLLLLARPPELKKEGCDLVWIINETFNFLSFQIDKQNIKIIKEFPSSQIIMKGDRSQLRQLFLNLFLNSIQHMENGGELCVKVIKVKDQQVLILITDSGCGISKENQEKIFSPFFTTKKGSTGLGLSICYGIVLSHDGDIAAKSTLNHGTTVEVKLPLDGQP